MTVDILTVFPEMFESVFAASILGRAREQGLLDIRLTDIRPFSAAKHKNTDDYPFGGGAGMVMTAQPIMDAMAAVSASLPGARRIYLGPRGKKLTTQLARELARRGLLEKHRRGVALASMYCFTRTLDVLSEHEGAYAVLFDALKALFERDVFFATVQPAEISIGDYILTGGELAAMVLTDCVARFIPGVLGSSESPEEESFSDGLLEYPQYTRPRDLNGRSVPEVLLNGDHAKIAAWRRRESLRATLRFRPDLLEKADLSPADLKILKELENECSSEN